VGAVRTVNLHDLGHAWTFGQLPAALAELDVHPKRVLHVGAHLGQEVPHYRAAGIDTITLVEPTPKNAEYLRSTYPDVTVVEVACGSKPGPAMLGIGAGDGAWNTIRPSAGDAVPVTVVPVYEIQGVADMIVVDTQGTELDVLDSASLDWLRLVVVEVSTVGSPEASSLDDVTAHMRGRGWQLRLLWSHDRPGDDARGFADAFYTPLPTWTIAIATLGQRRDLFQRLLDGLLPQVDAVGGRVQVRACWDNGEASIAAKRQALVEATHTDYLSFVDDDDTVTGDYVSSILEALETRPDFVGLWMQVWKNGREHRLAELSLKYDDWFDGPTHYCRDITHENPMRTSILSAVDFRDKPDASPEDTPWAAKLRGRVKTEVMIDRVLYHYWWVPAQSAWGTTACPITETDRDGVQWSPAVVESPNFTYLAAP